MAYAHVRVLWRRMPDTKSPASTSSHSRCVTTPRPPKFYGETLGLPFVKTWGKMPASEYQAGNLTLAVMQSDAFGIEFAPSSSMVALAVDDVARPYGNGLEGEGISFRGDLLDSGVCHQAFFADPDGNLLALHHRYAPKELADDPEELGLGLAEVAPAGDLLAVGDQHLAVADRRASGPRPAPARGRWPRRRCPVPGPASARGAPLSRGPRWTRSMRRSVVPPSSETVCSSPSCGSSVRRPIR